MLHNFSKQISRWALILLMLLLTVLPQDAYAIYDGVRQMKWDSDSKMCVNGGWDENNKDHSASNLYFDPFSSNMDISWELSNGVCIAYVASVMAGISAAGYATAYFCNQASLATVTAASVATGVPLSPAVLKEQGQAAGKCSALVVAQNYVQAAACCGSLSGYVGAGLAALGALGGNYAAANNVYKKARLCGHDWQTWGQDSTGNWVKSDYVGSYKAAIQDGYKNGNFSSDLTDYRYREYLFGGKEFADNGDGSCKNPWDKTTRKALFGYDSDYQRYYMTGSGTAPVFACYRFSIMKGTPQQITEAKAAYDCCVKRSQNVVCIENALPTTSSSNNYYGERTSGNDGGYGYKFCQLGSRCNVEGIWFDAYQSKIQTNYGCVKTYSVCPYNHPLGGGTEIADYSSDDKSVLTNYCQYLKHCSKLPVTPYSIKSTLSNGFFDSSCQDMKGDAQNVYKYSANFGVASIAARGFSAPMAQCFKETLENVFFNTAGHTLCADPNETPALDGTCQTGYKYRKGDNLSDYQKSVGESGDSFFVKAQKNLQSAIKMVLSIAIMFFGISVLIGGSPISKKQLLTFVVKIGLVMFFAAGDGWQLGFVDGILGSSAELSDVMFNPVDESTDPAKLDGCQFPKFNYADDNEATRYNNPAYPPGKSYLRIWDTMDCKITRALGYGVEVSVPNFAMMLLAGIIAGGAMGVIFFIASFVFAFFLISLTIRAIHIFVLSTTAIILMIYISPITITAAMFAKTKGIFDKWWKNLLSFALQPVILFAYLGILFALFDTVLMGDVTFSGDGKTAPKQVVCSGGAVDNSVYCIFNQPVNGSDKAIKTYNGLKMLGIGLPVLATLNEKKISTLIKAAFLFFIFMQFLDKISDLAKKLTGGDVALPGQGYDMTAMMQKTYDNVSGAQKRAIRGMKKHGMAAASGAWNRTKGAARAIGMSGRGGTSAKDAGSNNGGNMTGGDSRDNNSVGGASLGGNLGGSDSGSNSLVSSKSGSDSSSSDVSGS